MRYFSKKNYRKIFEIELELLFKTFLLFCFSMISPNCHIKILTDTLICNTKITFVSLPKLISSLYNMFIKISRLSLTYNPDGSVCSILSLRNLPVSNKLSMSSIAYTHTADIDTAFQFLQAEYNY